MTYINAVKYLSSLPNNINDLSDPLILERMRTVCSCFENPERHLKCIHVCGDVGKDSCSTMLASILSRSSYKVGRYSTPHSNDFKACISVDGKEISYSDFTEVIKALYKFYKSNFKDTVPHSYEIITLAALIFFKKCECDMVILEKGITRYDPINITDSPIVSLIAPFTDRYLESSVFENIIHKGTTETVSSPQHKEIYNAISNACSLSGCRLTIPVYSEMEIEKITLFKTFFKYKGVEYSVRSFSPCQTVNAITAIEAAASIGRVGADISADAISKGIASAYLDGKCETLSLSPTVILSSIWQKDRLDTLLAALGQIKEHLPEKIFFYIEDEAEINVSEFSASLSSCNIPFSKISNIHQVNDIPEIIKQARDPSQACATVFIGKKHFISQVKDFILKNL